MEACAEAGRTSAVEQLLNKRRYGQECKFKIAQYSSSIIQDPSENIGRLSDLTRLAADPLFMKSASLRQLLVASLCIIYKDILPAYKIRLPTEKELSQKVKKETKKIWRYEEILLRNFEKYVLLLQTILKDKGRRKLPRSLRIFSAQNWTKSEVFCAIKCACTLFENNPLFNFASDLLGAFLPYLQKSGSKVRQIVFRSLKLTFSMDTTGESTLMVCRGVHRLARSVNYRIRPDVASAIAGISIKEVADPSTDNKTSRKNRKLASRRERKKDKVFAKFEKDQAESKAAKSHEERLRMNAEILKEILFVYFKVLKTTKKSELLSAVLSGLSTYAHIINVEYVENLLQLMGAFIANPKTSLHDGLYSVHTALTILNTSSATSVLKVDPTRFYSHLYVLLGRLAGVCISWTGASTTNTAIGNGVDLSQYAWARTPAALAAQTLAHRDRLLADRDGGRNSGNIDGPVKSISPTEVERFTDIILACLDMLLVSRRRDVSITRVLAFVKRLASLSLVLNDTACLASILVNLWKLLSLFPKCEVLFDSDTEIGGPYDPEAFDPQNSRPASAALWELHVLRTHESPLIRKIVTTLLKWTRQAVRDGGPKPTNEVVAPPDHTLESLSGLHPAERRLLLARAEALCLSEPVAMPRRGTSASKRNNKSISPWLRELMTRHEVPGSTNAPLQIPVEIGASPKHS